MRKALLFLTAALVAVAAARADEGMWLFTAPPTKLLQEKYQFEPTSPWLAHLRKSCVRFPHGSGSFVSPDGLILTNHHIGLECLQQISTPQKDYVKDGFLARTRDQEIKCRHQEINVLMDVQDVTARVNDAVKAVSDPAAAEKARRAVINTIEKESEDKTGLKSEVVTLYEGGLYHLYRYKKYTDVRLVFAPEQQIAFYGGDPDNFEYPRYDLDMCVFRAYEGGKPAHVEDYLTWSEAGAKDHELVFVAGHPGRTDRDNTLAELDYLRDRYYPFALQMLYRREAAYSSYGARSDENARRAKEDLFTVQNSRKAREGGLEGLLNPRLMARKKAEEQKLRDEVARNPDLKEVATAWTRIADAQKALGKVSVRFNMLEGTRGPYGFNSDLFALARTLVRGAEERARPNPERLREYGEANLKSLEQRLLADQPIYKDFETVRLAESLTWLADELGAGSKLVRKVLAGKSPHERAAELVGGSRLEDVGLRKKLWEGGKAAVDACKDPMIELARLVDPEAREVRKTVEAQGEVKQQAHAQIAKAKFAAEGTSTYPDATFTLRLAFGVVKGYEEEGKHVPFETTFRGLYERAAEHHNRPPFHLPPRWLERKDRLDLDTPLNFVCTADIIGGNSGSPVVNRKGEVVGLIFDGNIQSLVLDFIFTEQQARAVAVHSRGILEALRKVYDAEDLANELAGKR
jgi:hypothetical protein